VRSEELSRASGTQSFKPRPVPGLKSWLNSGLHSQRPSGTKTGKRFTHL
jgi:hypothetical protein